MKRINLFLCLLVVPVFIFSQTVTKYSPTRNYAVERNYFKESKTSDTTKTISTIVYSDAFGNKIQEIQVNGAGDGIADLIMPYQYSSQGLLEKQFLVYPKTGNSGALDMGYSNSSNWNSYGNDEKAYSFTQVSYDNTPMQRLTNKTGPGKVWQTLGKGLNYTYAMNNSSEVHKLRISNNGSLLVDGYYAAGTLQKIIAKDEDGHANITYTDNEGTTLLETSPDGEKCLETYYVYDDRGLLCRVLSPKAVALLGHTSDQTILDKLAYHYEYDEFRRLIISRMPECDPVYTVYDVHDRAVMTQDGKQRHENTAKWTYHKYDSQNREMETGEIILSSSLSRQHLQNAFSSNAAYRPTGIQTAMSYFFYDNYAGASQAFTPGYSDNYHLYVTGKTTRERHRIIGTDNWKETTFYYDNKGRIIQNICTSNGNKKYSKDYHYDFSGNLLKERTVYSDGNGISRTLETNCAYDSRGRILSKSHKFNDKTPALITYGYDNIGRLTSRTYGNKTEHFTYNSRGWMTNIQSPDFTQNLYYENGPGIPCYNGNISAIKWKTSNETNTRGYKFGYDTQSRLINSEYGEGSDLSLNSNRFNEHVTGYDMNGNLLGLVRYGQTSTNEYGRIDNLAMSYDGNRLLKIDDSEPSHVYGDGFEFKDSENLSTEYYYDANGNLTKDLNKNIVDIQYNFLNLPQRVQFEDGSCISFLYSADGTKLQSSYLKDGNTTTTDYCSDAIYENGILTCIQFEEGYVTVNDGGFHYYLKDHQGNNRLVVKQDGVVEEVNHYYPFGGIFASSNSVQPYKYNGKELNRNNGLDWYDYGARMYDAAIGRWHVVDPLSETYYGLSPYLYCGADPINHIDPTGMDYWRTTDPNEIGRFMNTLSPFSAGNLTETFNFSSWDHSTDADFISGLTFNDETNMFYSSFGTVRNGEFTVIGVSIPALGRDDKSARIDGAKGRWYRKALGAVENVYPEFEILTAARGLLNVTAKAAVSSSKELFNFSAKAAKHMAEKERTVPIQIMQQAIKGSKGMVDPRGSKALMYTTKMWKNGKQYNLEVLYNKASNSIWHFKYY